MTSTTCVQLKETLIEYALRHAGEYQHPRLHGCRRYDYTEVIGRVESGTETESDSGRLHGSNR